MDFIGLAKIAHDFNKAARDRPYYLDKSSINGTGVFASRFIPKGALISKPVTNGAELITYMGSMINHQFDCNAKLVENNQEGCDLIAIRDIRPNEEITVNYKDTPWYIDKDTEGFIELE